MKKKSKIFKITKKGFSLIEVLISLMVLSLGIGAITTLSVNNIKYSLEAKNQIIAMSLAQEGVEIIRNYKDNNPSFTNEIKALPVTNDYRIGFYSTTTANYSTVALLTNNVDISKHLSVDNTTGFYRYGGLDGTLAGATKSKFFRKARMSVNTNNGKNILNVTVYVSWAPDTGSIFPFTAGTDDVNGSCTVANKCISITSVMPDLE